MASDSVAQPINYRLNLIAHRWSALVTATARSKYRIKPAAMRLLTVIARYEPISPGELVERTALDSPKVARAVSLLVDDGLVWRAADPNDGRRAVLTVTPKGAQVFAGIDAFCQRTEDRVTASLTQAERRYLELILDKLEGATQRLLLAADAPDAADAAADEAPAAPRPPTRRSTRHAPRRPR